MAAGFKEHIKDSIFEIWPIIVFAGVDSDGWANLLGTSNKELYIIQLKLKIIVILLSILYYFSIRM